MEEDKQYIKLVLFLGACVFTIGFFVGMLFERMLLNG